jgi:hypothetical protein
MPSQGTTRSVAALTLGLVGLRNTSPCGAWPRGFPTAVAPCFFVLQLRRHHRLLFPVRAHADALAAALAALGAGSEPRNGRVSRIARHVDRGLVSAGVVVAVARTSLIRYGILARAAGLRAWVLPSRRPEYQAASSGLLSRALSLPDFQAPQQVPKMHLQSNLNALWQH